MKYLTIGEFAKVIGVTIQTLRNWDRDGKLKPHHRTAGGQRMYVYEQVEKYFKESKEAENENE